MKEIRNLTDYMAYDDMVKLIAETERVDLSEAKSILANMPFSKYRTLKENPIVPPSGQTISPSNRNTQSQSQTQTQSNIKSVWPGKGSPVEVGMTVGMKDQNGMPIPGQVSQVDLGANGVKIKNPTTGKDEWMNTDTLEPFMAQGGGQTVTPTSEDDEQLERILELAGIKENCSAGATGAGAIAIAPAAMGGMKKRQPTEEMKKEYVRTAPAKTIVGDTKPNQASGELSANLAASGKKSAGRIRNGRKQK